MPFTPFHLGPGLAMKALAGRHLSVLSFGCVQVLIDIEPLLGLMRGAEVLHGRSHTYVGAWVLAVVAALLCAFVHRLVMRRVHQELSFYSLAWLAESESVGLAPIMAGACIGAVSHVGLDSLMHADLHPFAPWYAGNGLLGLVSVPAVYAGCAAAACIGLIAWIMRAWRARDSDAQHAQ